MVVVIDNGSSVMKVGIAGDDNPKHIFPTVVSKNSSLVGVDALEKDNEVTHPIHGGMVMDWDSMELVWQHAFQKVGAPHSPVLLTEAVNTELSNRKKVAELMFEKFAVPSLFISNQPVLSLLSTGRKTGMVLEIGDGITQVVPIFAGFTITEGVASSQLAGAKVTEFLRKLLELSDRNAASSIKETLCYLTEAPEVEMSKDLSTKYTLPDGSEITVGKERVKAPELLFNPTSGGLTDDSLQKMMTDSLAKCEMDVRKNLAGNTVFSGGSSKFPGMADRLATVMPSNLQVVRSNVDQRYMAWIGASIIASQAGFGDMSVTRAEFEEGGINALQKKCP